MLCQFSEQTFQPCEVKGNILIIHIVFQPINLISGSSYEQVQNKDSKFNGDKMSTGMVRKGVQAHADGEFCEIPLRKHAHAIYSNISRL